VVRLINGGKGVGGTSDTWRPHVPR